MKSGLYLKTFGGGVLLDGDGQTLDLAPKPLAVLVLLRLQTPLSRRDLERFLWQGVAEDSGNALSQALLPLRRRFPDLPKGKGAFVWPDREGLPCDVDVLHAGQRDVEARRAAVLAYEGTFLKDFRTEEGEEEFRHWVQQRQDEYEALFRRLWQAEVAGAVAGEGWAELEKLARHAIALDRYWQPGHAALVRALASGGHADAARRHYGNVCQQLEQEDGGYPVDAVLLDAGATIDEWTAAVTRRADESGEPQRPVKAPDDVLEPEPTPGLNPHPAPPQPRWRRRAPLFAAGAVVLAMALFLARPGGGAIPGAGEPVARIPDAPLCGPGEARASLVEQDYKADPMNVVPPTTHFTTVWHLQNVGRCTWPASFRLHREGAKPLSISDRDIPAQRTVFPGDTILFPSPMIAPYDEGVHRESWVVLDERDRPVPLGHGEDKLSAAIRVMDGPAPTCGPAGVNADLETRGFPDDWPVRPGERFTYEWTFMNRGGCAWDGALALRFVSAGPRRMSDPRVIDIPMESRVLPSEGYTFEIPMRAPEREGTYVEEWSLVYGDGRVIPVNGAKTMGVRMAVHDNAAAVPIPRLCGRGEYAVAWMKSERPVDGTVVRPGGVVQRKMTVANRGTCTWDTGSRLTYVRSEFGPRLQRIGSVPLTRLVAPRASYTFTVPIQVPYTGTRYREYWSFLDAYGDTAMISLTKAVWADLLIGPQ
jgi:DNA-binding SARP family transcriptional activator